MATRTSVTGPLYVKTNCSVETVHEEEQLTASSIAGSAICIRPPLSHDDNTPTVPSAALRLAHWMSMHSHGQLLHCKPQFTHPTLGGQTEYTPPTN